MIRMLKFRLRCGSERGSRRPTRGQTRSRALGAPPGRPAVSRPHRPVVTERRPLSPRAARRPGQAPPPGRRRRRGHSVPIASDDPDHPAPRCRSGPGRSGGPAGRTGSGRRAGTGRPQDLSKTCCISVSRSLVASPSLSPVASPFVGWPINNQAFRSNSLGVHVRPSNVTEHPTKMGNVAADQIVLWALPIVLVATALYGLRRDKGWLLPPSPFEGSSLTRGPESWNRLNLAFGIVSVNVLQIVGSSDALPSCRAALGFVNLAAMIYLFFFNGWFRNMAIKLILRSQTMEEPVR